MSKRLLVVCLAVVAVLGIATSAMAGDLPAESLGILLGLGAANSGHTAGTILNPEGKGDVLIFPYYDVREINGKTQDFYFLIINQENETCDKVVFTNECHAGMAAKLRFREWDKSEEVFDVDIWMSKGDVWVGVLTHNLAIPLPYGTRITSNDMVIIDYTGGAYLGTPGGGQFTVAAALAGGFDFPTSAFIPPGSSNLMGYIEVIGEENTFDKTTTPTSGKVQRWGSPSTWTTGSFDALNQLSGYAYILRVLDGQSLAYNATAIANFNIQTYTTLFFGPGNQFPTLGQAEDTLDELEFQISKERVTAGFSIEDAIAGQFSLILTFPTKWFHFCPRPNYSAKGVLFGGVYACTSTYPLVPPWTALHANASEKILVTVFDRNENRLAPPKTFISPTPQGAPVGLPFEVNVISLYKGTPPVVPAANIRDNVAFSTTNAGTTIDAGYVQIEFLPDQSATGNPVSSINPKITKYLNFGYFYSGYQGLPVLGLSLQEFSNFAAGGWYGDIRPVFYDVEWVGRARH